MKITQVHYQKLTNLGDYQNQRVGAWANVEDHETPETALATLTAWVDQQITGNQQLKTTHEELEHEIYTAQNKLETLNRQIHTAQTKYEKMQA